MRALMLALLGCGLLAGCANPVDKVAHSVESVTLASVKYPIEFADWTVEKAQEQRERR